MQNPFQMMAVMAAAMSAAFSENKARDAGMSMPVFHSGNHGGSSKGYQHQHNPAGSKLARKWAKAAGIEWNGERAAR